MTSRSVWLAAIGLCGVLLAPLLIVDVPPLLDYPNHLARVFVLASLPDDPVLARFYAPNWSIIPNLGLDLVGPALIQVLPVHVAGRLLIAAALLLPAIGTLAYNAALGGRGWALGVGLVAYNSCLLAGFLNFEIGIGLALLLAAGWLRWRESHPVRVVLVAMIGAPVLFACHLMGVAFFGFLIGGAELVRVYRSRSVRVVVRRGTALGLVFTVPLVLYGLSDLNVLGGDAVFLPPGPKLLQLATTFANYDWPLDMATAAASVLIPVVCVAMGWGRVPGPAAAAIGLLAVAFVIAPHGWKGTFALDTRFAIMLGFMAFAGFVPSRNWVRHGAAAGFGVLFAARMALLVNAWTAHRADVADMRAVLAPVRAGQAVYVAEAGPDEAPAYWRANPRWRVLFNGERTDEHLGALAVIEHRAYWPFAFDNPSQQPIVTREPYRSLAERFGHLPNRGEAAIADLRGFDYVLLMAADAVPALPAGRFRLVAASGFAALYEIRTYQEDP